MTGRRVAIVTDSSASLPPEIAAREPIITVPISAVIDGETFLDGELPAGQFYDRLKTSAGRTATTTPEPRAFIQAFHDARETGAEAVLCLVMSSRLSATFKAAEGAAQLVRDGIDIPVRVVDTHGLAMTHGFAVLAAAESLRSGATIDEAAQVAVHVGSTAELVGALDTLRYLARGGRVPRVVHWATSALQIKPVLAWSGGDVRTIARPRTMIRALNRVVEYAQTKANGGSMRVAAMHAGAPRFAAELAALARERLPVDDVMIAEFTCAMGVHTGPGFAGLAFYAE